MLKIAINTPYMDHKATQRQKANECTGNCGICDKSEYYGYRVVWCKEYKVLVTVE